MLDGIYPEDMRKPESNEDGVGGERKATYPVKGVVYLDGTPAVGAWVMFSTKPAEGKKPAFVADAFTEGDGSFVLSTYGAFDGAPVGEYLVSVRGSAGRGGGARNQPAAAGVARTLRRPGEIGADRVRQGEGERRDPGVVERRPGRGGTLILRVLTPAAKMAV